MKTYHKIQTLFKRDEKTKKIILGDYSMAEFVKGKGKKVIVISTRGHISKELAISATKYIPFEKMRRELERKNHPRLLGGKSSK